MKKITILSIIALFFGAFAIPQAEAHGYKKKFHSTCSHCRKHVYAYYRPMVYHGVTRYAWVPSYHSSCRQRSHHVTRYHHPTPYIVPRIRTGSCYQRSPYSYGRVPYYTGFRPGFSITIRR